MKNFRMYLATTAISISLMPLWNVAMAEGDQRLTGIDVSHHNNVSDWSEIKSADISFVILKATDGMDYLDPTFTDRFKALKTAGLIRGAYHFYETNDSPLVQANLFIKNAPLKAGDLPPIVDIERVKAPATKNLHSDFKTFLKQLEGHYGVKPIIYTGTKFWNHVMKEHLADYPLWIAEYGTDSPTIPDGWQNWTMWQYTDARAIPNVDGDTDGSHFNGGADALSEILLVDG